MCKGGGSLAFDRKSRGERWGVATNEEIAAAVQAKGLIWLDVRTADEVAARSLPASLKVKHCNVTMFSAKELEAAAPTLLPNRSAPIMLFCAGGGRAQVAVKALQSNGYTGTLTNAGMIEDLEEAVPDFLQAAASKKKGSCIVM